MKISWEQALAWRIRRQYLIECASPADLVRVVDRLRGLHAQLMLSVDLALLARIDGLDRDAVANALWRKRTLVKIWAMRTKLHVLPAADLGTWIAGLGIWKPGGWPLKDPEAIPLANYIDKALRGNILTRAISGWCVRRGDDSVTQAFTCPFAMCRSVVTSARERLCSITRVREIARQPVGLRVSSLQFESVC
jgi:hypothetical protein